MNAIWHPDTEDDIDEGVDYYFRNQPGIEEEFIASIEAAVLKLIKNPQLSREFEPPYRKITTGRFPFQIIYRIREEDIKIVAVMHQSRREINSS